MYSVKIYIFLETLFSIVEIAIMTAITDFEVISDCIYLFIYSLFKDAFSVTQTTYIALNKVVLRE
jgi:hypothetical protein